jgi:hypothetical protein
MNTELEMIVKSQSTISKPLAPEDIKPGMFIAIIMEIHERGPMFLFDDAKFGKGESTKVARWPCMCRKCEGGEPLQVVEVCLPFVLVKRPKPADSGGEAFRTLDVRQHRLTKLSEAYGKIAHKLFAKKPAAKSKKT